MTELPLRAQSLYQEMRRMLDVYVERAAQERLQGNVPVAEMCERLALLVADTMLDFETLWQEAHDRKAG